MAMTNAERQRNYRARALKSTRGTPMKRLQLVVESYAAANLTRLSSKLELSKREVIEKLINEAAIKHGCSDEF